jgi:GNAT superfamily N-acetyltransferase
VFWRYPGYIFRRVNGMSISDDKTAPLPSSNLQDAAAILARALFDDPMAVFIFPDSAERVLLLQGIYMLDIEKALLGGEVYTTPSLNGISVWLSRGKLPAGGENRIRAVRKQLAGEIGDGPSGKLAICETYIEDLHDRFARGNHCYLLTLGVEPTHQGKGIGGRLLQPVLMKADKQGCDCYAETMSRKNLEFYGRHGFVVKGGVQVPGGGPYIWALVRNAAGRVTLDSG